MEINNGRRRGRQRKVTTPGEGRLDRGGKLVRVGRRNTPIIGRDKRRPEEEETRRGFFREGDDRKRKLADEKPLRFRDVIERGRKSVLKGLLIFRISPRQESEK